MCFQFTAHGEYTKSCTLYTIGTMNVRKYRCGLLHVHVGNISLFVVFIFQPSLQINIAQYMVCLSTMQLNAFFSLCQSKVYTSLYLFFPFIFLSKLDF